MATVREGDGVAIVRESDDVASDGLAIVRESDGVLVAVWLVRESDGMAS